MFHCLFTVKKGAAWPWMTSRIFKMIAPITKVFAAQTFDINC